MTFTSSGLLVQIIGTILLSLHLFKSPQEENDESSSWWGQNPFGGFSITRKLAGFSGLLLLIIGFSMQFADLNVIPISLANTKLMIVISFTSLAVIFGGIGYLVGPRFYQVKRTRHFAEMAGNCLQQFDSDKDIKKLSSSLSRYRDELPRQYSQLVDNLWILSQEQDEPDQVTYSKSYQFDREYEQLKKYLVSLK